MASSAAPAAGYKCVVVGDPVAEPQLLAAWLCLGRTPNSSEARGFTTGKTTIGRQSSAGGSQTVAPQQHQQAAVAVSLAVEVVDAPDRLPLMAPPPAVVVMCYTPLAPSSHENLMDVWSRTIDRMFPRPIVLVCGTRVESLGNRKVVEKMKRDGVRPVGVVEACDALSRYRAVNYVEVSVASHIGLTELQAAVASAVLGEAARRATPEVVTAQRSACIQSVASKQAVWTARRDKHSNRLFFFNRLTRRSVWNRPEDYDGEEPELTQEEQQELQRQREEEEEERLRAERDRQVAQQYLKDVAEHEQRMSEMETRSDRLTAHVKNLQTELEGIRRQIQVNSTERAKLEQMRESISEGEVALARTTAAEDELMERELQLARNRAFELEAVSALKLEQDFDLQLSEGLIRNRSLATRLRELLQEQLAIQKCGAQSQAKSAVASRSVEEATKTLTFLKTKAINTRQQVSIVSAELEPLEEQLSCLHDELSDLRGHLSAANYTEIDRHRREVELIRLCGECDAQITSLKAKTNAAIRRETADDRRRLVLERRGLASNLAQLAADCAVLERQVAARHLQLRHLDTERLALAEKVLEVMTRRFENVQRLQQRYFEGQGFSPVPTAVLAQVIADMKDAEREYTAGRDRSSGLVGSHMATATFAPAAADFSPARARQQKNAAAVAKSLSNRLEELDSKGKAMLLRVRKAAEELRRHKSAMDSDATRAAAAIDGATALLRNTAAVGPKYEEQPLERLKLRAGPALLHDPVEMRAMVEVFAKNVLRCVPAGELQSLTSGETPAAARAAAAAALFLGSEQPPSGGDAEKALRAASVEYADIAASMRADLAAAGAGGSSPLSGSGQRRRRPLGNTSSTAAAGVPAAPLAGGGAAWETPRRVPAAQSPSSRARSASRAAPFR